MSIDTLGQESTPVPPTVRENKYYMDMRDLPVELAGRLLCFLPFPTDIIRKHQVEEYHLARTNSDESRMLEITESWEGKETDCIIVLFRALAGFGCHLQDPRIADIAWHDCRRKKINDMIIKGKRLDLLYPN